MSQRLIDIFSQIEEYHWWFEGRRIFLKKIMDSYLDPKRQKIKILDIGCGTGSNINFLSKFGEVYGVDNYKLAIDYCKRKGYKNIKLSQAYKLPYPNSYFNIITMLDVLEHIEDDKKALMEAKRVLKKDGLIVITSPALPFIWSKHDTLQGHFRRYTKSGISDLSSAVKLKIGFINHYNVLLSPLVIGVRLASKHMKFFAKLGEYDSKINFDIANKKLINKILLLIIKTEVSLVRWVDYPIGISVVAVLSKDKVAKKI